MNQPHTYVNIDLKYQGNYTASGDDLNEEHAGNDLYDRKLNKARTRNFRKNTGELLDEKSLPDNIKNTRNNRQMSFRVR